MRTGLVAVGAAIAIIGAGVMVIALATPLGGSSSDRTGSVVIDSLVPGDARTLAVNTTASTRATVSFSWNSSGMVAVSWYVAYSCSTPRTWCIEGSPLASWSNNTSGVWSVSGSAAAIYCVSVDDNANQTLNFIGELREQVFSSNVGLLPVLPVAWTAAGGVLLIGIGGISTYLGLFLPGNVYGPSDEDGPWEEVSADEPWEDVEHPHRNRPAP